MCPTIASYPCAAAPVWPAAGCAVQRFPAACAAPDDKLIACQGKTRVHIESINMAVGYRRLRYTLRLRTDNLTERR